MFHIYFDVKVDGRKLGRKDSLREKERGRLREGEKGRKGDGVRGGIKNPAIKPGFQIKNEKVKLRKKGC